jgi:hypothetical protein
VNSGVAAYGRPPRASRLTPAGARVLVLSGNVPGTVRA